MKFIPQLNSLRAIAVLFVIASHYYINETSIFSLGSLGVDIFFYLSGFLITSIMINDKIKIAQNLLTKKRAIISFYKRRALRIFPLYYLVIFSLYAVAAKTGTGLKENIGYFILYVPNWYFYEIQSWDGILSHLWSLGVEEQYYLCWPFIFFFTERSKTIYYLYLMIILSLLIRIYYFVTSESVFYDVLTINCMYKFGFGALIVYKIEYIKQSFFKRKAILTILMVALIFVYILLSLYPFLLSWIIKDLIVYYFVIYVIVTSIHIKRGILFKILSNKILIELGTISYGIYVFHVITLWLMLNFLNKLSFLKFINGSIFFNPLCLLTTILMAYISYYYFEIFFLRLKKKI